jgi:hypothetical protein
VITAEADVLRDEGEAYGRKLRAAGVDVTGTRDEGIIHDFVMLNALHDTNAAGAAIAQAIAYSSRRAGGGAAEEQERAAPARPSVGRGWQGMSTSPGSNGPPASRAPRVTAAPNLSIVVPRKASTVRTSGVPSAMGRRLRCEIALSRR